jgi:predicted NUDIX family NTP pyrophosphohydrolase
MIWGEEGLSRNSVGSDTSGALKVGRLAKDRDPAPFDLETSREVFTEYFDLWTWRCGRSDPPRGLPHGQHPLRFRRMPKYSAGLLPYRVSESQHLEVLLVHPGGPFWAKKDDGAWSIPKGEYEPDAEPNPLSVAEREFAEEIGRPAPRGDRLNLGELKQPSGKRIVAWGVACDLDVSEVTSNSFEMEWPPKSGTTQSFPEVDRAAWFSEREARLKVLKGQEPFVDRLIEALLVRGELLFHSPEDVTDPNQSRG